jgi:hypothetical protein
MGCSGKRQRSAFEILARACLLREECNFFDDLRFCGPTCDLVVSESGFADRKFTAMGNL